MNEDYVIISVDVPFPFKDKEWYKLKNVKTGMIYRGAYTSLEVAERARSRRIVRDWNVDEIGPTTRRELLLSGGETHQIFYTNLQTL